MEKNYIKFIRWFEERPWSSINSWWKSAYHTYDTDRSPPTDWQRASHTHIVLTEVLPHTTSERYMTIHEEPHSQDSMKPQGKFCIKMSIDEACDATARDIESSSHQICDLVTKLVMPGTSRGRCDTVGDTVHLWSVNCNDEDSHLK